MPFFSFLHLTDFHQGMDEQAWLLPGVKHRFFEDLGYLHDKYGPWDLVLFTGDLTQKGSAEEFQKFDQFLEQLWEQFDKLNFSPTPKLLAVPGNHDLVRPDEKDYFLRLLQHWHDDSSVSKEFWHDEKSPFHQVITKAFKNYTDWQKNHPFKPDNLNYGILPGDFSLTFEKDDAKLGIVGLNTSFLQLTGDDYEGKLVLHAQQFQNACGGDGPGWAKQHHACLLMTHHPPKWLNHESLEHLNGEIATPGRFAVHLCGHLHETNPVYISEGGAKSKYIWQSRSLFGLEYIKKEDLQKIERSHGYAIGEIKLKGEQGTLTFWPRIDFPQIGGSRKIKSDPYVNLIDELYTTPIPFDLLKPYVNGDQVPAVEKSQYDIFVSYVQKDNEPLSGTKEGWVTTLITKLKNLLGRKLGNQNAYSLWMDNESRGNAPVPPHIINKLKNSAILLLIVSPDYFQSTWCQSELQLFLAKKGLDRIVIVEREKVLLSEELRELSPYKFSVNEKSAHSFDYQTLNDLVIELTENIKGKPETGPALSIQKTVFLAQVSDDLEDSRNTVKRYLKQRGVHVLPNKSYSILTDNIRQEIDQDLKQSSLFVQLLSDKSGHGFPKLQYEQAKMTKLPILQWCTELKVVYETHSTLLSQSTIFTSKLVEFRENIVTHLEGLKEIRIKSNPDNHLVFINAEQEDIQLAKQIQGVLKQEGIDSHIPSTPRPKKAKEVQQALNQHLLACHAVIVVYNKSNEKWVNEQVLYCRRMQAQREKPFKIVAIYDKSAPNQQLNLPLPLVGIPPNVPILNCPTPITKTCLPQFIKILKP